MFIRFIKLTLQAYLYRTKEDFEKLIKLPGSIRLVKGVYETTKDVSIPRGDQLDSIYLNYVERLFAVNHKCSIASHHDKVMESTIKLIEKHSPGNYVLERLLGICNEELEVINDLADKLSFDFKFATTKRDTGVFISFLKA